MTSAANGQETSFFDENKGLIITLVLALLGVLITIHALPVELAQIPMTLFLAGSLLLMLFVHGGRPGPFLSALSKVCNENYDQQFSKNFWDCRQAMTGSTMLVIVLFPFRDQLITLILLNVMLLNMGYSWYAVGRMLKRVRANPSNKTIGSFVYWSTEYGLYVSIFTAVIYAVYQLR